MSVYRSNLPQLSDDIFLTDGGIETTLIFHYGLDLPHFAAFDLFKDETGRDALRRYFRSYLTVANENGIGIVLETATWRASADWGDKLGYSSTELAEANRQSVALLDALRTESSGTAPVVISGCIGPRGDGYDPSDVMTSTEAERYHRTQIQTFADTRADMVTAITMTNIPEAIGLTRAAQAVGIPAVISYTVETDGRLPTGETLQEGIEQVDAATENGPAYFMINCAHPTHFSHVLETDAPWVTRLQGLRANASAKSHAELDEAEELDEGDPHVLGGEYAALRNKLPNLAVLGGCCGTDHRHIAAITTACRKGQAVA
ncbi:MAG: homocysteine S-methyltransferase [Alphaproteobacteria bacterium]|nr:homocysteine S-methyltransferase [Alphaproteobacteria bacterium]